jgi:hypothetical protein
VYADGVNLLTDNINTMKQNKEALTDASKEGGLEINSDKPKYMLMSCHQNAEQNFNIKMANYQFLHFMQ